MLFFDCLTKNGKSNEYVTYYPPSPSLDKKGKKD